MKTHFGKISAIILLALIAGFISLPSIKHQSLLGYTPEQVENLDSSVQDLTLTQKFQKFLHDSRVHLGLDLQGGTQLDYKIDLRKVPETDRDTIIDGVKEVINRRVNNLGVSEPNIFVSSIGDEQHIVVELAGIKDLDEAKQTVGKIIQLEFKEERTAPEDPDKVQKIHTQATDTHTKILSGQASFEQIGEEEAKANPSFVQYQNDYLNSYQDGLTREKLKEFAFKEPVGTILKDVVEILEEDNEFTIQPGSYSPRAQTGFALFKLIDRKDEEREIYHPKEVKTRHILISFSDEAAPENSTDVVAEDTTAPATRTKEEARLRAQEVLDKIKAGQELADLAAEYSDDPASKENRGLLLNNVVENSTAYETTFTEAALKLKEKEVSEIIETSQGFHLIKTDQIIESFTEKKTEPRAKIARILFSTLPDPWQETGLTGEQFVRAEVAFNNLLQPYVQITFDNEGAQKFEEITTRNIGKSLAIFVGGDVISAPRVNSAISGGIAQITGQFTTDEAQSLARDLNTGAIPAPITLAGQFNIGASLGENALQTSLKAGLIGLLMLALYLLLYYRLPGLLANLALIVYGLVLMFLIKVALPLGIALLISIVIFIALITKILHARDSFWEKLISFILACFVLFFLTFLLTNSLVLTLAGVAGIILSIGMAVDANILIFERIKEELKDGKPFASAIEIGFDRAWSSIRDSNYSSLITCAILFYFGSSIIRGFAFNLATGILVSMFTAITVTKTLLSVFIGSSLEKKPHLMGVFKSRKPINFNIIKHSHRWFNFSGLLIILSIFSIAFFGFRPGIDFTGGTLMQVKFPPEVTTADITSSLQETQDKLKNSQPAQPAGTTNAENTTAENEATLEPSTTREENNIEFGSPNIVSSENNSYIIRIKHISNETHDLILKDFEAKFGPIEETRFTTVGPTIGKTLAKKAFFALVLAMGMIILYIAFAFRHVPKYINPWRFGSCAIVALIHDVLLTLGLFSILGQTLNVEIDALFITALLTIIGFSVHDTIVVFDRIRENLQHQKRDQTFGEIANIAMNQTMTRSINTSLTALLTLIALLIFGSESIRYFILALTFGITVGTYSSICIASPLLVAWREWKIKK